MATLNDPEASGRGANIRESTTGSVSATRSLAGQMIAYAPGFIAAAVTGGILLVVLARGLPVATYGRFVLASSIVTVASALGGDWLAQVMIFLSAAQQKLHIRDESLRFPQISAATLGLGIASASAFALGLDVGTAIAVCVATAVGVLSRAAQGQLRRAGQSRAFAGTAMAGAACALVCVGLLLLSNLQPLLPLLIIALALQSLPVLIVASARPKNPNPTTLPLPPGAILAFGLPIIVTSIGGQALVLADRFVIAAVGNAQQVGEYAANYNLAEKGLALGFAPMLFALQPLLVRDASEARAAGSRLVHLAMRATFGLYMSATVVFALEGKGVSHSLLGPDYARSWVILPVTAAALGFWNLATLRHQILELERTPRKITQRVLVAATVNVVATFGCVLLWGPTGAAIATLLGYVIYFILIETHLRHLALVLGGYSKWYLLAACGIALAACTTSILLHVYGISEQLRFVTVGIVTLVAFAAILWRGFKSDARA